MGFKSNRNSSNLIPETYVPQSWIPDSLWVEVVGFHTAGQAMGCLGLTYSNFIADTYTLKYQTQDGVIKGVNLI